MGIRELVWLLTKKIPGQIREWALSIIQEKAPVFFQTQRRVILLCLGGAAVVLILGLVLAALLRGNARSARAAAAAGELTELFKPLPIAPEDIFLPEEPDVLPEFIPARPQREAWTAADAAEYWTDPLAGKEALWRDRYSEAVEDMLEAVP
jgi:hypothetical protein